MTHATYSCERSAASIAEGDALDSVNVLHAARTGLSAARAAPGCRYALRNHVLAIHRLGGGTERRVLGSVAELREVLETVIGVAVPLGAEVDQRLGRVIEGAEGAGSRAGAGDAR